MTPFNGDKIRPRLAVKAGNKTFSWIFDTGAAVTCINKESFDLAFGHYKPKQIP
jgi:Retroviral aspartyl protease